MILHDAAEPYLELIQATAEHQGIPAVYVEKDYWVTLALKRLHESDYKNDIVFKGGTALSKAHRLINRFSEDIDLALRTKGLGDARRKRLIKGAEQAMTQDLEYQAGHPQESKHSRFRKTAHAFPTRTDASELGQVADIILLEINALADPEPATAMPIASLVHDFLADTDRANLVAEFELHAFDVLVLHVERTLCEKIMGLVRAGYEDNATTEFRRRIRHFYDIVLILREPSYQAFVGSKAFAGMLDSVKDSDRQSMPNAEVWLDPPLVDAPVFANSAELWDTIKTEFYGSFKEMVYGDDMPRDAEVLEVIGTLRDALANSNDGDRG